MDGDSLVIVAVSIIWAAVLVASAMVLAGTDFFGQMVPILGGGAASTIVIMGGARAKSKTK